MNKGSRKIDGLEANCGYGTAHRIVDSPRKLGRDTAFGPSGGHLHMIRRYRALKPDGVLLRDHTKFGEGLFSDPWKVTIT